MTQYSPTIQRLLARIDDLKAQIDALRPIKPELVSKIFQKFRLDWNYNSNSIEGNSLSYGETAAFLMEGLTAKGKPLKDHLDIKGHNDAITFLLDMQKEGTELMERDIRGLHEMILVEPYQSTAQTADGQATTKTIQLGVYKSSPNHVRTATGEIHYYASPEETPARMQELMTWYRENLGTMHPLILSALFHHRFVDIHPFDDGNGRMSRLLSNLILMQGGFPPIVVRHDQKREYYGVLSQADAGVTDPLVEYFAELLIHSQEIYLKGAQGGDISEVSDLEKQLALFVAEFDEDVLNKKQLSADVVREVYSISVRPLINQFVRYALQIEKLFFEVKIDITQYLVEGSQVITKKDVGSTTLDNLFGNTAIDKYLSDSLVEGVEERGGSQYVQLAFTLKCTGFKAAENTELVSGIIILNFYRDYYQIMNIILDNTIVKKNYIKPVLPEEIQKIMNGFFTDLMEHIRIAKNKALSE